MYLRNLESLSFSYSKDLDRLFLQINPEQPAIYVWLCSNKLTLNLSKKKYWVFQLRQKINCNLYPPIKLADQYREQSRNIKYLGLVPILIAKKCHEISCAEFSPCFWCPR